MSFRPIIMNIQAGVFSAVLELFMVISFAVLIFSGPMAAHLATGLVVLLISATVVGLIGTLGSGYPGMLVSLRAAMMPIIASMVAAIAAEMTAHGREAGLLATVIVALGVTSIVTGLALGLLGHFGLGRLVRYFPYPVMAGLFAGTGAWDTDRRPRKRSSRQAGCPALLRYAGHLAWPRNPQCTNIRTGPVDGGRSGRLDRSTRELRRHL